MKQHNELQQELLQHVLQYHDSFSSIENLAAAAVGTDSELSGSELRDRLRGSLVRNMCCWSSIAFNKKTQQITFVEIHVRLYCLTVHAM